VGEHLYRAAAIAPGSTALLDEHALAAEPSRVFAM
jgi:hypothetical protein